MAPDKAEKVDLLDHTINTISAVNLRQIFKSICKACPEAKKHAEELLLADKEDAKRGPSVNEEERGDKGAPAKDSGVKQPVPRYAFCVNCEKEFDVTTNTSTSCLYHTMEDEPDDCLYEDNPTNTLDPDSMEAREEYPEFFWFKCCGRNRDQDEPCAIGWHQEMTEEKPYKRARASYVV